MRFSPVELPFRRRRGSGAPPFAGTTFIARDVIAASSQARGVSQEARPHMEAMTFDVDLLRCSMQVVPGIHCLRRAHVLQLLLNKGFVR